MIVAIHQPNYAPWLGYFAKMARADAFVLLDDAQFTKNSYINRVQIDAAGAPRWLTVPVRFHFGDPISRVRAANDNWPRAHCDTLKTFYASAPLFPVVWPSIAELYASLPADNLAASNEALITGVAQRLGIKAAIRRASNIDSGGARRDDRLIAIVRSFGTGAAYLSGRGGAAYQDPAKFEAAGIHLRYADFVHPIYDQGRAGFVEGLSVLDALFRIGWDSTADLVARAAAA